MSNKPEPNFDWGPYVEDVISFYVAQNHTREETTSYLHEKYGIRVTTKQFKTKFAGCKNISREEWKEIIPRVQKRTSEGKDSAVYRDGNRIDPKRLKLGISRYSSEICQDGGMGSSSNTIGQNSLDRIVIATPPSAPLSPPIIDTPPAIEQEIEEIFRSEMSIQFAPISSPSPALCPSHHRMSPVIQHDAYNEIYDFADNFDELFAFQCSTPNPQWYFDGAQDRLWDSSQGLIPGATEPQVIDTVLCPMQARSGSSAPRNYQSSLLATLPWFQLQEVISRSNITIVSPRTEIPRTCTSFRFPAAVGSSGGSTSMSESLNECGNMLTKLLGKASGRQVGNVASSFTVELQKFLPERQSGDLSAQVQRLFDPSHKQPVQKLFEIAAYFSSNNMLSDDQTEVFVEWVIDQNFVDQLKLFLQIDMPTARAFRSRLVEAGIRAQRSTFLKQMKAAGANFDEFAHKLMDIKDSEFLLFVLSQLDPNLLRGESGGQLLQMNISRAPNITVVEKLIDSGAEVNITLSDSIRTTPLWQAVSKENLKIVECLIKNGADVNKLSLELPASPLAYAVYFNARPIVECLFKHGANTSVKVFSVPILDYAACNSPGIYRILLESAALPGPTVLQIVSAADSDTRACSKFLSQNCEVSEQKLEEALVASLALEKTRAVVNLLQQGVDTNGSHLPENSFRPIRIAIEVPRSWKVVTQYMDLLIEAGVNVNVDGLLDYLILDSTVAFPTELVDKLIKAGLDLDKYGPEVLVSSVISCMEMILFLLDRGVPINSYGKRLTVLQAASENRGETQLVRLLVGRGANINALPYPVKGRTALQAAAQSGSLEMVWLLVGLGADINGPIALIDGVTTLEAAVRPYSSGDADFDDDSYGKYSAEGSAEVFLFLLDQGAAVNRPDSSPSPLLHDLIEREEANLLRLALEAKATTNHLWETWSATEGGRTPLQLASKMGQLMSVKLLLDSGADPNELPAHSHGRTALQAAASSETPNMELLQLLLDHKAAVNAPPAVRGGITALQGAAIRGHINIAHMLIENGAEVNAFPALKYGRTAIEGAAEHGRLDMVQMLLNAGAVGDVIGTTGVSKAIDLARENRHFVVAELLEAHQKGKRSMF